MSFDQSHADALSELADVKHENAVLSEDVADLVRHNARLHLLLAEHGVADPARANLSPRERRVLEEADKRGAQ